MAEPVLVIGHKNPDNDAICSAVGYAYLQNELARCAADGDDVTYEYKPVRLGPLPLETAWVLDEGNLPVPDLIHHVYARVSDVMTQNPVSISRHASLLEAGRALRTNNIRALVVCNDDGTYYGLITTRMIANRYIEATDAFSEDTASEMAVASDLIASLAQKVEEITETEVLELHKDNLLRDAIEDLMGSSLREAVVLDDDGFAIGMVTRSDVAVRPHRKVVIVDHNERTQAVDGVQDANVMAIVDHHRIGDVTTARPITFLNMPVGSTSTIVTLEFQRHNVDIPPEIARVLLSAVLTDTVILKSPTTTDIDREQVKYLADIVGVDPTEFGLRVFKCREAEDNLPVEKLVTADSKEYQIEDNLVLIGQYETVDRKAVLKREDEIRAYMRQLKDTHKYEFVLFMITDIVDEGSQFLVEGNRHLVNRIFGIKCTGKGGTWMPGVMSRKKQVASRILGI